MSIVRGPGEDGDNYGAMANLAAAIRNGEVPDGNYTMRQAVELYAKGFTRKDDTQCGQK